jgi:hypothetical protein
LNRRGFFAALFSIPVVLRAKPKLKPKPKFLYVDTDSVVFRYPDGDARPLNDDELRLLFKFHMNTAYGKLGAPRRYSFPIVSVWKQVEKGREIYHRV